MLFAPSSNPNDNYFNLKPGYKVNLDDLQNFEEIFRNSKSSDELFDAFQNAIKINLCDLQTFKILLANPTLSPDEIKMFTEKLIKKIPNESLDLLLWTGKVLENHPANSNYLEDALIYYRRAISTKPNFHEPLLKMLNLHNYEIELPTNPKILEIIEESVIAVNRKSKIYYALAHHYKKFGDSKSEAKYIALAERSVKKEYDAQ